MHEAADEPVTDDAGEAPSGVVEVFAGSTATVGPARKLADAWLAGRGASADLCERVALVVSELASNAVQAAPGRPYELRVGPGREPGTVTVSVVNEAIRSDVPSRDERGPDHPLAPRGRGLFIVEALARSVAVARPADGQVAVTAHVG